MQRPSLILKIRISLPWCRWIVGFQALNINRDNVGLLFVPQDLNASVTTLSLKHNNITVIDYSSLWRYRNLTKLSLSFNPLQEIKSGSYDNNPDLEAFGCIHCALYRLPADFGPATNSLRDIWFAQGIQNATAFHQIQLSCFAQLRVLSIRGLCDIDFDQIFLVPSFIEL